MSPKPKSFWNKFTIPLVTLCLWLVLSGLAFSQAPGTALFTVRVLVSQLPISAQAGWMRTVTDGNSASDCTVGGGSTNVFCVYNGSAWAVVQGAAGAVTFDLIGSGTNTTAAMHVGAGATLDATNTGTITANLLAGTTIGVTNSSLVVEAASAVAASSNDGNVAAFRAGDGDGIGGGGNLSLTAGNAGTTGSGGTVLIGGGCAGACASGSATNRTGGTITIAAGRGTGTATESIIFQVPHTLTTGSTLQTQTTQLTINDVNILLPSGNVLCWNSDSGISRLGAASLAMGTCTNGDFSGALKLASVNSTGIAPGFQFNGLAHNYFVTTDFTTANNTNPQTITGLSWTFPASQAMNVGFRCNLLYSQATGAVADTFQVLDTTVAATNSAFGASAQISSTVATPGNLSAISSTSAQTVVTFTPSATATVYQAFIWGNIEQPSNASTSVFAIQVQTSTGADAITIKRGSQCNLIF